MSFKKFGGAVALLSLLLLGVGCAGVQITDNKADAGENGVYYVITDVSNTNVARRGATYVMVEKCYVDGVCTVVSEQAHANPTLLEQLAGPGAMVGSSELLRRGIEKSGDTVTATGGGGGSSHAGAQAGSQAVSISNSTGGCKGNCGK